VLERLSQPATRSSSRCAGFPGRPVSAAS
jgi:hypothetical protein